MKEEMTPSTVEEIEEIKEAAKPREVEVRSDIKYEFSELHGSPNKYKFRDYLYAKKSYEMTESDKHNFKILKKRVSYVAEFSSATRKVLDKEKLKGIQVLNDWHKYLSANAKCPCGSGKKWKKCHRDIVSPYVPCKVYTDAWFRNKRGQENVREDNVSEK